MNTVEVYLQATLALAAYAKLGVGKPNVEELKKSDMSTVQAGDFAKDWRVIDQFTDSTGVSATTFEKGGQRYLAVRGTELSLGDILADGVLALGVPEKLNQQYIALKTQMEKWQADPAKLGGQTYTVSGHSLGGYLAAALKRSYPEITAAYLYNAPGTGGLIGNLADLVSGLFTDSVPGAGGIWNIKGSEGASFITGLGSQASPGIPIHIEQDPAIGFDNHSVVRLTDALAIHALYARIFPDLSASNRNVLLDASGGVTEETLEAALDALRELVLGPDIAPTIDDECPASDPQTRDRLFSNLYELQKSPEFLALGSLSATLLTGEDAARLTEMAYANTPEGQAVRYAMENLNPFFVPDASYAIHNTQGELDLFDPQTGRGSQTQEYLKDRAALLERKMWFSLQEKNPVNPQMQSGNHLFENEVAYYEDIGNRYKIAQGTINDATPRFLFGSDESDVLEGKEGNDHLYGMAGLDLLTGNKGADYLEGGSGLDFYRFRKNDGADTLLDTDRRGLLQRNNELLVLAFKDGEGWKGGTGENPFTATKNGNDLVLTFTDNAEDSITLKDFDFEDAKSGRGSYGLRLIESEAGTPNPVRRFIGDTEDWDNDRAQEGTQRKPDGFGNHLRADGQAGRPLIEQTNRNDIFLGSPGNETERFETGGGSDLIYADGPDSFTSPGGGIDLINAGKGRDIVAAGGNNDRVEGGEGGDILGGNSGNDLLYAESAVSLETAIKTGETAAAEAGEADLLTGDGGNDTLIGSAWSDALFGGLDRDIVVGGGGDDDLYGDGSVSSVMLNWVADRQEIKEGTDVTYKISYTNAALAYDPVSGDADVLVGGAGGDWMFAGGGDDLLLGGEGKDVGFGDAGNDVLQGGADDDVLAGDNRENHLPELLHGDDILDGGDGEDTLLGNGGNDVLIGGKGSDILVGGKGKDVYVYNKGDGEDVLVDTPFDENKSDASVLVLGEGIKREDVKFRKGSLWVDMGNGDGVHFENFDADNPYATPVLGELRFADGGVMSYDDVLAQGFDLDGTNDDDTILGTAVTDRIRGFEYGDYLYGKAGDDVMDGGEDDDYLSGGEGNDFLLGGTGNDRLNGGTGDDTYRLNRGDGADALVDAFGMDTLQLGAGIVPADLQVRHYQATDGARYLELDFGNGDRVSVRDGALGVLENVVFADGTTYRWRELLARLPALEAVGTAADDLLVGTAGDDVLDGSGGNDTIEAGAGNDDLIGGSGHDRLIGGSGSDTYHFAFGTGRDTVVEGAGESCLLVFESGLLPIQLQLTRDGDDLVIGLRGQPDAIRIAGFHAGEQPWQFRFGDGEPLNFAALSAAVSPGHGSVAALRNDYKSQIIVAFAADKVGEGYVLGGDGNFHNFGLEGAGSSWVRNSEWVHGLVFTDQASRWGWVGKPWERSVSSQKMGQLVVDTGNVSATSFPSGRFVPVSGQSRGASDYGDKYVFVLDGGQYMGSWHLPGSYAFTEVPTRTVSYERITYRGDLLVPELVGGREVGSKYFEVDYREAYSGYPPNTAEAVGALVSGGKENDMIVAASAMDGMVSGRGAFLYGDDGDDSIHGGDADDWLIGGRGHDVLDGGHGGDTYYLLEEDSGDTIRDSGNDWTRFQHWYYREHGVEDIELSEQYGGKWILRGERMRVADSLEKLREQVPDWALEYVDSQAEYVPPLPDVPMIAANDYAEMEACYGEGALREDTLRFGDGVTADNLLVMGSEDQEEFGSLLLHGPQGRIATVALPGQASGDEEEGAAPSFGSGIEYYQFANGSRLTLRQMVERMRADHDMTGGDGEDTFVFDRGNDKVRAGGGNDVLSGGAGSDNLDGGAGNDFLDGGRGDDRLVGGAGDDVYRFGRASGHDVIVEAEGGVNRIVFADDVAMSDLVLERLANPTRDLVVRLGDGAASLTIVAWGQAGPGELIDSFQFGEFGGTWSADELLAELRALNTMPDASVLPASINVRAGQAFLYTLPSALLDDREGDSVTISVDEGALPEWMSYDADSMTLHGTAPAWESNATMSVLLNMIDSFSEDSQHMHFDLLVVEAPVIEGGSSNDQLFGTENGEILNGRAGDDRLYGRSGDDWLVGGEGNDLLNGGAGADVMEGGADNDTYYVDNTGDFVTELAGEGTDRVVSTTGYTLGDNVENLTLLGADAINGTGNELNNTIVGNAGSNTLSGLGGNDSLTGGDANDTLLGGTGTDALNGGLGADVMEGGADSDTYYVDNTGDFVIELAGKGTDRVIATISYTLGDNVENIMLSGTGAINGIGNALANSLAGNIASNLLNGDDGNDTLNGAVGVDFLEGMAGNDTLVDTAGNGFFNGGSGADRLTGGVGADIFLGGTGDDTINTGVGDDLIAFNRGDGYDAITLGTGSKTVSLGGGIAYSDLQFRVSGTDLVLDTGTAEGMNFNNWYSGTTNKNVLNLQIIAAAMADFDAGGSDFLYDQRVDNFNFAGLASAFDAARTANPCLTRWALTDALMQFQLAGFDSAALGGDLAYQYGRNGTLAGIGLTAAQQVIGNANFGSQAQTLWPLADLQGGAVRLS